MSIPKGWRRTDDRDRVASEDYDKRGLRGWCSELLENRRPKARLRDGGGVPYDLATIGGLTAVTRVPFCRKTDRVGPAPVAVEKEVEEEERG